MDVATGLTLLAQATGIVKTLREIDKDLARFRCPKILLRNQIDFAGLEIGLGPEKTLSEKVDTRLTKPGRVGVR